MIIFAMKEMHFGEYLIVHCFSKTLKICEGCEVIAGPKPVDAMQPIHLFYTQCRTLNQHHSEKAYIVASELKDPICHSLEWQIGSFSSEATI